MNKLNVYLDTNTIYGFIKEMVKARQERRDYRKTRKITFMQDNLHKMDASTSFFSFMEAVDNLERELRVSKQEINNVISIFRKISGVKSMDRIFINGETYKWFLSGIDFKDSIQVNIAKNRKMIFVSEDKKLVKNIKSMYAKTLVMSELENLLNNTK